MNPKKLQFFPFVLARFLLCLTSSPVSAQTAVTANPVTSARTGTHITYNVGPGQTYTEPDTVPWGALQAGDVVNIYYRSTPYRWKIGLRGQGTQSAPIVINGVTDASGNRPAFDFNGARTASGSNPGGNNNVFSSTPEYGESLGGIVVKRGPNDAYGSYSPQWIEIRNLELHGAANGNSYTTLAGGTAAFSSSAGVWLQLGNDILLENLAIYDNGFGIFTMAKDGLLSETCSRVTVRACRVYGNGVAGSYLEHNFYMQCRLPVIEGNYIGRVRPGSEGSSYKSRCSGEIFRYNYVEASARAIDWVFSEEQDINGIVTQPEYGTDFAYGNVILNDANASTFASNPIHYGGDNLGEQEPGQPVLVQPTYRRHLYFWNNTVIFRATQAQQWRQAVFELSLVATTAEAWNNIIVVDSGSATPPDTSWVEYAGHLRLHANNLVFGTINNANSTADAADYNIEKLGTLIAGAPQFVNQAANDFHLLGSSPAVNAGGVSLPADVQAVASLYPVQMQPHLASNGYDVRSPLGASIDLGALESGVPSGGGGGVIAPAITVQPAAQTTVAAGGNCTLSVTATGTSLQYQWYKDGTLITNATNASYTVANMSTATAGSYTVVVSNSAGSVTSTGAAVSLLQTAPAITTQPSNQSTSVGQSASFLVVASGTPVPTCQWQRLPAGSSTWANLVAGGGYSGVTSTTLTISSPSAAMTGDQFRAVLTNAAGSATSNAATLTVSVIAPVITVQPAAQTTVAAGGNCTLSVTATGTSLQYQWYKDGTLIANATNASYTVAAMSTATAGSYTVVVSNSAGSVTSTGAAVSLSQTAPVITVQPAAQTTVAAGGSCTLSVTATGTSLQYQWYKDGTPITNATNASYTVAAMSTATAGSYTVVVRNNAGSVTSTGAAVSLSQTAPVITVEPASQANVAAGGSCTLSVTATGTSLQYQWYKDGTPIANATNASYTVANMSAATAGSYTVVVSNSAGSVTSTGAAVSLSQTAPVITVQPASQTTVAAGGSCTLSVTATGTSLKYQWYKDGTAIANATNASYTVAAMSAATAGSYTVLVSNSAGSVISTSASVNLPQNVPVITAQPASQTNVAPGGSCTLSVTATGTNLQYQWYKDGTAIAGATNATYTVANAQAGNMGFYTVTVNNGVGSVGSAVAIVTVSCGRSRLTGLSTRGYVPAGGALTPGFYLRGRGAKALIVRGVGPTLSGFGVAGPLSDPKMDLIPVGGTTLLTNDDWGTNANLPALRAAMPFPLVEGSKDAAALTTLSTATNTGYTMRVVPGSAGAAGIAMAEVYDLDDATAPVEFFSLSTLGYTGPGDNILTPGFIITGDGPKQLLIRAVGPTLGAAPYNVPGVLADPQFRVVPLGKDLTVASNDNWGGTAELQAAFAQTNDFALPTDSKDAAAIVRLPPGGYTIQVTGVGGTTGNVLVEVYDMDP